VEELETTNEELQSTNEELETMNEELQSTNEELRHLNDQLLHRSNELYQVNGTFESVLATLRSAVAVLDHELQIRFWSARAEEFWGLRKEEAEGAPFLDLDIGLPVQELEGPVRAALARTQEQELTLDGVNRRGRAIHCRVRCTPLAGRKGIVGVVVLMEEEAPGSDAM
jgi:two-component system CheB/CheR fusion protein